MSRRDKTKTATQIFDDLDTYLRWCADYGYVYNERDLYKNDTNWGLYQRWRHGDKSIQNNWAGKDSLVDKRR